MGSLQGRQFVAVGLSLVYYSRPDGNRGWIPRGGGPYDLDGYSFSAMRGGNRRLFGRPNFAQSVHSPRSKSEIVTETAPRYSLNGGNRYIGMWGIE